jgi:hypothetical protein
MVSKCFECAFSRWGIGSCCAPRCARCSRANGSPPVGIDKTWYTGRTSRLS